MVGAALCRNWPLIQRLAGSHGLTLLARYSPVDEHVLKFVDVIALDCREHGAHGAQRLVGDIRRTAGTPIVVLDGGLSRADIAALVSAGAQDYFAEPFNVAIIAERLAYLADSSRSRRMRILENER